MFAHSAIVVFGALRVNECIKYLVFFRPQHTSLSKIDISEDNEPGLSKLDVVLSFTLEVRTRLQILDSAQSFIELFIICACWPLLRRPRIYDLTKMTMPTDHKSHVFNIILMAESSQLMPLINTGNSEVKQIINLVQPFEILCFYHRVIMLIK